MNLRRAGPRSRTLSQSTTSRLRSFFTGRFYRTRANRTIIERLKHDGHYLGPHSDAHLLYADWNDRDKTLVTREQFERDLNDNFAAMRPFGIDRKQIPFFLPPYEWYNHDIVRLGLVDWITDRKLLARHPFER